MPYKSLREFVNALEKEGELIRIKEFVNPLLEITEITDRISKSKNQNKALLFENTGTPARPSGGEFPLLINAMGSEKRICMALSVKNLDDIGKEIESLMKMTPPSGILDKIMMLPKLGKVASYFPKVKKGKGECQQIIWKEVDLNRLPIMKCWPEDGGGRGEGRFLTMPVIHTKDPETGIRNVGLYRMQMFEKNLTALHWQLHKVSAKHFRRYKELGIKKMPVAVSLGGDPIYTYAGSAPMPEGIDEYILAGFIRKKSVELVKCITNEMLVPADSDFVIEGYVDTEEDLILEGPFGDHTGYYSLEDWYPKFHVTCITQRKDAIYPSTIVGIPPQEDAWIGKATERIFIAPIKMTMMPEMIDMNLPAEGVFHNLSVIKIKKDYEGQAHKVIHALWGAGQMMLNKMMIVTDEHCDIHDLEKLAYYVSENCEPSRDIIFSEGPIDVLDHACSKPAFGGKFGIDATRKKEFRVQGSEFRVDTEKIKRDFPDITDANDSLLAKGISVAFLTIEKNKKGHVRDIAEKLLQGNYLQEVKFLIVMDKEIDIHDIAETVWRFTNNIDAKRDCFILGNTLIVDGTRKTKQLDGFDRDWPNILTTNIETIEKIDAMWSKLGLGEFISSPSRKHLQKVFEGGAIVESK